MTPRTAIRQLLKVSIVTALATVAVVAGLRIASGLFATLSGAVDPASVGVFTIVQAWYWHSRTPSMLNPLLVSTAIAGTLVLAALLPLLLKRRRSLHGTTDWAKTSDLEQAGLFGPGGIVIGKSGSKFLTFDGSSQGKNVMCAAPPGSGKTAGLMIPNCLAWPGSLVALDLKGECYERTAGYRESKGQKVVMLNFMARDYRTHQYDPFAYVSTDKNFRIGGVEKIARYLVPDRPNTDPIWTGGARELFQTIALFLLETKQPCTLGTVFDTLNTPEGIQAFAHDIVQADAEEAAQGGLTLPEAMIRDLSAIALRPAKTLGGQKDELNAALAPLKNPLVRLATDANSVDLRKIRSEATSIYVTVERPDLNSLKSILNLFFQQLVDLNSTVEFGKDPTHKFEVLLAMDEIAQMGKLEAIFNGIVFFRSYGLRLLAILQSVSQTRETYGAEAAKTFEQSFDCSVFFTPASRDTETPELISKLLGKQTVKATSHSSKSALLDLNSGSQTKSDFGRALLLPQEVSALPIEKQIVIISGQRPITCDKIRVWKEPAFKARNGKPPIAPLMNVVTPPQRGSVSPTTPTEQPAETLNNTPTSTEVRAVSETPATRPIALADMENLETMTLKDFDLDFSKVAVPKGKISAADMDSLRATFFGELEKA